MAKLVLGFNGETLREFEIDQEIMTIGRRAENDIHIDNLAVSANHAKVLTILNDSFIEDLDSTNGTYINGKKVGKYALQNGDIIAIGKHQLTYVNETTGADTGSFEKTLIIRPDAAGMPVQEETDAILEQSIVKIASDLASAGAAGAEGPGEGCLKLLSGANDGKELKSILIEKGRNLV